METCLPPCSMQEILAYCNFLQFNTLHGATPPVQRCRPDWMMMSLTKTIIPNSIGVNAPNFTKFGKVPTLWFQGTYTHLQHQQSRTWLLPRFELARIPCMFQHPAVSHLAECNSTCATVQTSLVDDDDRPLYYRGHASVQQSKTNKSLLTTFSKF